jgi:predicted nuclease of restriction endonuclease-like RecB superfamily
MISKFKHPIIVQVCIMIAVAIITSYLTIVQASIPRKDAEILVHQSEERAMSAIDRLDKKQDQILDKLEKIQIDVAVIKNKGK